MDPPSSSSSADAAREAQYRRRREIAGLAASAVSVRVALAAHADGPEVADGSACAQARGALVVVLADAIDGFASGWDADLLGDHRVEVDRRRADLARRAVAVLAALRTRLHGVERWRVKERLADH